jgi:hypothetical protein
MGVIHCPKAGGNPVQEVESSSADEEGSAGSASWSGEEGTSEEDRSLAASKGTKSKKGNKEKEAVADQESKSTPSKKKLVRHGSGIAPDSDEKSDVAPLRQSLRAKTIAAKRASQSQETFKCMVSTHL